jgi:hypothetical protein
MAARAIKFLQREASCLAKEPKTALQLADIIRSHIGEPGLKIGVFFDKERGWRATVYDSKTPSEKQPHVDQIVRDMRSRYELDE